MRLHTKPRAHDVQRNDAVAGADDCVVHQRNISEQAMPRWQRMRTLALAIPEHAHHKAEVARPLPRFGLLGPRDRHDHLAVVVFAEHVRAGAPAAYDPQLAAPAHKAPQFDAIRAAVEVPDLQGWLHLRPHVPYARTLYKHVSPQLPRSSVSRTDANDETSSYAVKCPAAACVTDVHISRWSKASKHQNCTCSSTNPRAMRWSRTRLYSVEL